MSTILAQDFEITGTLGLPASRHSATVPDASLFLNAHDADRVQLGAGFIDAETMVPYETGQAEGLIEEWSIDLVHNSIKCKIAGRDRMAELLEHEYDMSYLTTWPTAIQVRDMQDAGRRYKVGYTQASKIAQEVAASCGMDLVWNCRDYTLREDFTTNGRAIEQIQKLLDPWKQLPRFQADLYVIPGVSGRGVILCQARDAQQVFDQATGMFIPSVNCTFDVKDARIKSIAVSRKRSQRFKHVLLYGQVVPVGMRNGLPSELEEETESVTKDVNGRILTKTVTRTTYLMPDKRVLKVVTSTYQSNGGWQLTLVKKETRSTEWEESQYSIYGLINEPNRLSDTVRVEALNGSTWREESREFISYAYNAQNYLEVTSTQKWQIDPATGRFAEYERIVKEHREVSHLEAEEVTTVYKRNPNTTNTGGNADGNAGVTGWYPAQVDTARSAGVRPGGPKPPRAVSDGGPRMPLKLKETISTHLRARSVVIQNSNMTMDDLNYLMGCFRRGSGNWEWTIQMSYLGIPWLRKGMVVWIQNMVDNAGNPIPLQPALVTEQRLRYDETSATPSMISSLSATFWTSDAGDL